MICWWFLRRSDEEEVAHVIGGWGAEGVAAAAAVVCVGVTSRCGWFITQKHSFRWAHPKLIMVGSPVQTSVFVEEVLQFRSACESCWLNMQIPERKQETDRAEGDFSCCTDPWTMEPTLVSNMCSKVNILLFNNTSFLLLNWPNCWWMSKNGVK